MLLYFDIETFSDNGFRSSNTKIITIQYKDFDGNVRILKEWDSSESDILRKFFTEMKMIKKDDFLMLVGHNVLRFDIPMIMKRMVANGIGSADELHDFFHNVFVVDTLQCMLPFNNMRFKGLNTEEISKKLKISEPRHRNTEIESFYRSRKFADIEKHALADLEFIQDLYWKLKKEDMAKIFSPAPYESFSKN